MQLDCRGLSCPEPVIRTKNALKELKESDKLEIIVNEKAPFENIKRFLKSQNQSYATVKLENGDDVIIAYKDGEIGEVDMSEYGCEIALPTKVIYLNEDRAGSGEVGEVLLSKFLSAFLQVDAKPYAVICVNKAVNLTTNRANPSFNALKGLEAAGVKILSCGSCLEAYKLVDKLGVGEISNAFEIADLLSKFDEIKL